MGVNGVSITSHNDIRTYLRTSGITVDAGAEKILGNGFDFGDKEYTQGNDIIGNNEADEFMSILDKIRKDPTSTYYGSNILTDNKISPEEAKIIIERYHQDELFKAINNKDESKLQYLLRFGGIQRKGISLNVKNVDGNSPLMMAAKKGWPTALAWMIQLGGDIYTTNNLGQTALVLAAQKGELKCIALLCTAAGTKVQQYCNMTDKSGNDALSHIVLYGNDSMTQRATADSIALNKYLRCAIYLWGKSADEKKSDAIAIRLFSEVLKKGAAGIYAESYNEQGEANRQFLESYVQCTEAYDGLVGNGNDAAKIKARINKYSAQIDSAAKALNTIDDQAYANAVRTFNALYQANVR